MHAVCFVSLFGSLHSAIYSDPVVPSFAQCRWNDEVYQAGSKFNPKIYSRGRQYELLCTVCTCLEVNTTHDLHSLKIACHVSRRKVGGPGVFPPCMQHSLVLNFTNTSRVAIPRAIRYYFKRLCKRLFHCSLYLRSLWLLNRSCFSRLHCCLMQMLFYDHRLLWCSVKK